MHASAVFTSFLSKVPTANSEFNSVPLTAGTPTETMLLSSTTSGIGTKHYPPLDIGFRNSGCGFDVPEPPGLPVGVLPQAPAHFSEPGGPLPLPPGPTGQPGGTAAGSCCWCVFAFEMAAPLGQLTISGSPSFSAPETRHHTPPHPGGPSAARRSACSRKTRFPPRETGMLRPGSALTTLLGGPRWPRLAPRRKPQVPCVICKVLGDWPGFPR